MPQAASQSARLTQSLAQPSPFSLSRRRGQRTTSHLLLSWPATGTGFVLDETSALEQTKWIETKADVVDTAAEHTVTVPAAGVMKCYRLKKL